MTRRIEMIEEYIVQQSDGTDYSPPSYIWTDNKGQLVRCRDCKHFHYDMPYVMQGIPILGHEVCDFWGDGCKTNENGFCSYAEQKEREGE